MPHEIPQYMSANYVKDKTSVDILWRQLHTLQDIAQEFGIDNIFQDNGAEILQQLIYLNMKAVPGREGNDGIDVNGCEWEMKSLDISKGNQGITTNHHLNASIIEKYRTVPWSVSIYDGIHLKKIYVVGNEELQPLFAKWEEQLQTEASINNPKIPLNYIEEHGILIYQEGDEYPIDPMTVIDTTPYVSVQRAYFNKVDCLKALSACGKAVVSSRKKLVKAQDAETKLRADLAEQQANLLRTAAPSEQAAIQKTIDSLNAKIAKASTKTIQCTTAFDAATQAVDTARAELDDSIRVFSEELAQFLNNFIVPDEGNAN